MNRKQRIAINAQGGRGWLGGNQYTKNLVLALAQLPDKVRNQYEIYLISNQAEFEFCNGLETYIDRVFFRENDFKLATLANRVQWKILRKFAGYSNPQLDEFIHRNKIDFIYPHYSQHSRSKNYRAVAWICDFQHKHMPYFFSEDEVKERNKIFSNIAKYASSVVLSSKTAEQDFYKFFPDSNVKTEVLSFKVFPDPKWYKPKPKDTQEKYNLPERFFLISNQFWQHKNHLIVLEALKLLKSQSIEPNVVCTGYIYDYRKPEYIDQVLETIHCLGLAHQVYLLGIIKRQDQIQLMRRAIAVIQPSLFEGWSTVIEDARCLGKPIIMSDLEVNIEQNPPRHQIFERYSAESLAPILANWWKNLAPGPDYPQEEKAKKRNLLEMQKFGFRFLEILQNN